MPSGTSRRTSAPTLRLCIGSSNLGAVVTHAAYWDLAEGFEAEWRAVDLLTVEGDLINRLEVFDEADLDAALAKFDELTHPAPRPDSAASQANERLLDVLRGARLGGHSGVTGR